MSRHCGILGSCWSDGSKENETWDVNKLTYTQTVEYEGYKG